MMPQKQQTHHPPDISFEYNFPRKGTRGLFGEMNDYTEEMNHLDELNEHIKPPASPL